jgi:TPR repeat protein
MYKEGRGVVQSYVDAVQWYTKAADQGNPDAQLDLGTLLELGQGVAQDHASAER